MNRIEFVTGERRVIYVDIKACNGEAFTVREATFELKQDKRIVDSGACNVDGHTISAMIQPTEIGTYVLIFTFQIGGEILKETVVIAVEDLKRHLCCDY